MSSLETSLQIHEFSREFIDVTQKDGKFVSGGFGAEDTANKTYPVPDKIKEAVNRGELRINDNYPPLQQECALLAKEIDRYAILAVATREYDDKNRSLIAYRYFWLAKPEDNDDFDGIGTLILWWHESNQPKFNFQNDFKSNNLQYRVYAYKKAEVYDIFNKNFGTIPNEYIIEIKLYPHIGLIKSDETHSYLKLHHLALHLYTKFKTPLSWAWNVGILEKPKYFTIIWAANQDICFKITEELKKYQKLLESKKINVEDLDNFKPDEKLQECLNNQSRLQPQQITYNLEETLKELISNTANNIHKESCIRQIVTLLNQYSIHEYEKDAIIVEAIFNLTNYSYAPVKEAVIYRAIIVLLGFDDLYQWAQWLNNRASDDDKKLSFAVQNCIMQFSLQNQLSDAYYQLQMLLFHNYSNLLLKLSKISADSKEYKFIEWLLLKSNSVWRNYFKLYTQNLIDNVKYQNLSMLYSDNEFYQQIRTDLNKHEISRKQRLKQIFEKYESLSILIRKLGNNSLSALFYQLSQGAVPNQVYERADVQIIPLTRKQTIHLTRKVRTFIRNNGLFIVALLSIFISITGISWVIATEYLPQLQEKSSNR